MNNPEALEYYAKLTVFKNDATQDHYAFPETLGTHQRRMVHTIAHAMKLEHISHDTVHGRQVFVYPLRNVSPPIPQFSGVQNLDPSRRSLNRAATMDFHPARHNQNGGYNTLRGQQSSQLLGVPDSPSSFGGQQNLRGAKSVADLRAFTPSPAASTGSFPPELQNLARFPDHHRINGNSAGPSLTPTASGSALGNAYRDDGLVSSLSGMTLASGAAPNGGSPRRLRPAFAWEPENQQVSAGPSNTGAIGSNRGFSMNYDNPSQGNGLGNPTRQPRGPGDRAQPPFSRRQNGHQSRGSDELRHQNGQHDIIPE